MHKLAFLLCLGLAASAAVQAATETLYVRAQPSVALLTSPIADSPPAQRLLPDVSVSVLGRRDGFVNVQLADGTQGWIAEADLTGVVPADAQVAALEREAAELRSQLATAQANLRNAESRLRQAQQNVAATQASSADETAALAAERDRLQTALADREQQLDALRERVAELELAQESAKLLAAQPATMPENPLGPISSSQAFLALATLAIVALLTFWVGGETARRRLRRRYHGLEL